MQLPHLLNQHRDDIHAITDIHIAKAVEFRLVGYRKSTKLGFFVMGVCWRKMHRNKHRIMQRSDMDVLIGLNDMRAVILRKRNNLPSRIIHWHKSRI